MMKVSELKTELETRGLDSKGMSIAVVFLQSPSCLLLTHTVHSTLVDLCPTGLKADLIQRLIDALASEGAGEAAPAAAAASAPKPAVAAPKPAAVAAAPKPAVAAPKPAAVAEPAVAAPAAAPTEGAPAAATPQDDLAAKKAARAARFGIAIVETPVPTPTAGKKRANEGAAAGDNKKQKGGKPAVVIDPEVCIFFSCFPSFFFFFCICFNTLAIVLPSFLSSILNSPLPFVIPLTESDLEQAI